MTYQVAEQFLSINGEGPRAGQLAYFIRFQGCNLACSYCDTRWACGPNCPVQDLSGDEIAQAAQNSGAESITLTGGEPLLRLGMAELLNVLAQETGLPVEIETNGSVDLSPYAGLPHRPSFTMDYKLPGSGMEGRMYRPNFDLLTSNDVVKFVCASREDLERGGEIAEEFSLCGRVPLYFSPVFGQLDPVEIVEFMKELRLPGVRLQLQLHKFIWPPEQRGV